MSPLTLVIIATAAFVGTHFLMSHPLRSTMIARLGARGFMIVYSLVSFATLGWMVWTLRRMGPEPFLWATPAWAWPFADVAMLAASLLFAGSLIGNPALPGAPAATEPRGMTAITRHPMMWSFALWSLVHLLIWPQPSVAVLTLGILVLAVGGAAGQDAKKARLQPDFWPQWKAATGFIPFTGPAPLQAMWPGWGVFMAGILLWLVALWAHPMLGAPRLLPG